MSKRDNHNNNNNNDINNLELYFDIWSNILLFFDDLPIIEMHYLKQPIVINNIMCTVYNGTKEILSIERLMNLSLVCKMFRDIIKSTHLLLLWQNIFIYNICNESGIKSNNMFYDIHVNLIREIIIINHTIHKKKEYIIPQIKSVNHVDNIIFEKRQKIYEGISYVTFHENSYHKIKTSLAKDIIEYNKDVNKMQTYIRTFINAIEMK